MSAKLSSGGAAAAGGMDFQHRATAWLAVRILSDKSATPPWGLAADTVLERYQCETTESVDDIVVRTSKGGIILCQVKRKLDLSSDHDSPLGSALKQFVHQFKLGAPSGENNRRALDPSIDRLVLVTSSESSKAIRTHLPNVLQRVRNLSPEQSLNDIATNKREHDAISTVLSHIRRFWKDLWSRDASDAELRSLLCVVRIHVLDVEIGRPGEEDAKNLLRSAVLRNPDAADLAWDTLVTLCASHATQRSGADRATLQRELMNAGLELKILASYEKDIEKLRKYSKQTLIALENLVHIRSDGTTIKIPRACTVALREVAKSTSTIVIGDPGSGKSAVLHEFAATLSDENKDFVFLTVDRLAAKSLGELRQELGLEHELLEVLDNWIGRQPAFLVIDAIDAARDDAVRTVVSDLINLVLQKCGRWRVIASIRKFDLRYGTRIKQSFSGSPSTEFRDPEFHNIHHVNIPCFSEKELDQIVSMSPSGLMRRVIDNAPPQLLDLVRVPFNLRLVAELLDGGVSPEELTPATTQLELLDRYWLYRVVRNDGQGDAREAILRKVCKQMVRSRTLRADRAAVASSDTSELLHDLLSTQVLVEWKETAEKQPNRYKLAFSHHVLFDYAVARLLFRSDHKKIIRRLVKDPELVIVIRPSLVLHFSYLWNLSTDRREFWDSTFRVIGRPEIPEIGKIIGPTVAAGLARSIHDVEPLCASLEENDEEKREIAERTLRYVIGALIAAVKSSHLTGPNAGPWCQLLERVSQNLRQQVAYTIRPLLPTLRDLADDFTPEQRSAVGHTARRLLEFGWSQSRRDSWLVSRAIECVCRTFESAPIESASLIRRCVEREHLAQFGFEEMPWLARELKRLVPLDPELVADIYCKTFAYEEKSEEPTFLGPSRIVPMRSTRRQDYQIALYILAEAFPAFLDSAPYHATRVLVTVLETYVAQKFFLDVHDSNEVFSFHDQSARLRRDYSEMWDEGTTYRQEEPIKMLDSFQTFLEGRAEREGNEDKIRNIVTILVSENRLAVVWRRLLQVGKRFPKSIGREILPLAYALPILTCPDTSVLAGQFLHAIFPSLETHAREHIERAILSIPDNMPPERRSEMETICGRLLKCLPVEAIVTSEVRQRVNEQQAETTSPQKPVSEPFGKAFSVPYGEEDYLKERGVPIEVEENRQVLELLRPVKMFADKHLNSTPTLQEANAILPSLHYLSDALRGPNEQSLHDELKQYSWGVLAAACARLARNGEFCTSDAGSFVTEILLEASRRPEPVYNRNNDARFNEHPVWSTPLPRIEAAQGLITLARHRDCATRDVIKAIHRLSSDRVPAVRYQIAVSLHYLYRNHANSMWQIIERTAVQEKSRGVLQGLLIVFITCLLEFEPNRVANFTDTIFHRVKRGAGANKVRELCVAIFAELFIWRDHQQSKQVVEVLVSHPDRHPQEAGIVLGRLGDRLNYGPTDALDSQADAIRGRALRLLEDLLRSSRDALKKLDQRYDGVGFSEWNEDDKTKVQSLVQLIDSIASSVYFAAKGCGTGSDEPATVSRESITRCQRFYHEASRIFDDLASVGMPSVAHHLLETLQHFIDLDPKGVFRRIRGVVLAASQAGYQYESLAADLVVEIVERYLAEYRSLLQQDIDCCKGIIEILDIFVEAGWPSALRLAYRLEETYR